MTCFNQEHTHNINIYSYSNHAEGGQLENIGSIDAISCILTINCKRYVYSKNGTVPSNTVHLAGLKSCRRRSK